MQGKDEKYVKNKRTQNKTRYESETDAECESDSESETGPRGDAQNEKGDGGI